MIPSRTIAVFGVLAALLISSDVARSQASESAASEDESGVPVHELIAIVAKKTGKQFLVDPRVRARVTVIGQDVGRFDYSNLLAVLSKSLGGGGARAVPPPLGGGWTIRS